MIPGRWKTQVLACLFASPLLGCAMHPSSPAMTTALVTVPSPPSATSWAGYQQLLDQRIAAQTIASQVPDRQLASLEAPVSSQPVSEPAFDQRILAAHNREREGLGLAPLHWNAALAIAARAWADHLATTGRFEHAPENNASPEGENLWAGTKGYYRPEAMVDAWIREKRFFRPGTFPDNSTTGKVEDVGHYTQVVWRATREVGCAEARSHSEDILVCRYAEAGNYRGEQPF